MKKVLLFCLLAGWVFAAPPALWAETALEKADALYDQGGWITSKSPLTCTWRP